MSWQGDLAEALAGAGVEAAAWVPDKRLDPIAQALTGCGVPLRTLTREEECIAWASGYRAVGGSPAVLFQSSGLGNALNALGSLAIPYGYGFPLVLSMRGSLGERNPAQLTLVRETPALLRALVLELLREWNLLVIADLLCAGVFQILRCGLLCRLLLDHKPMFLRNTATARSSGTLRPTTRCC